MFSQLNTLLFLFHLLLSLTLARGVHGQHHHHDNSSPPGPPTSGFVQGCQDAHYIAQNQTLVAHCLGEIQVQNEYGMVYRTVAVNNYLDLNKCLANQKGVLAAAWNGDAFYHCKDCDLEYIYGMSAVLQNCSCSLGGRHPKYAGTSFDLNNVVGMMVDKFSQLNNGTVNCYGYVPSMEIDYGMAVGQ